MKSFRNQTGSLSERPYYTSRDIDQLCKSELVNQGLFPSSPEPIRIERFIEKRFNIVVSYEELPSGVLGWTEFGARGVEAIVVSRSLSDDGSRVSERRVATTLAHEAGHGLLHRQLFDGREIAPSLFGENSDVEGRRVLCREDADEGPTSKRRYSGRWWEYQANQMMGALLLPRELVERCLSPFLESTGALGVLRLADGNRDIAVRTLSKTFEVNTMVARIRASELYQARENGQLTL